MYQIPVIWKKNPASREQFTKGYVEIDYQEKEETLEFSAYGFEGLGRPHKLLEAFTGEEAKANAEAAVRAYNVSTKFVEGMLVFH